MTNLKCNFSSQHTCFKCCYIVFMVNNWFFPIQFMKWMFHNSVNIDFFPISIKKCILWILKFIDCRNNKCCNVFTVFIETYSICYVSILENFVPVHGDIHSSFLKVGHDNCWWVNDRPKVMNSTSFVKTLCYNMNYTVMFTMTIRVFGRVTKQLHNANLKKNKTIIPVYSQQC